MRLRYIVLALFAAFSALGAIAFFGFPQEKPTPASMDQERLAAIVANYVEVPAEEKSYTRIDDGNLVLIKQKSAYSTLEEVVDIFGDSAPVIIAKCYSVNGCLKARQIMEPLAHDDVVQAEFYTVIIEAFEAGLPANLASAKEPDPDRIVYMFALPDCGMDMGAPEYTSTALLEHALSWYQALSKSCEANQQ